MIVSLKKEESRWLMLECSAGPFDAIRRECHSEARPIVPSSTEWIESVEENLQKCHQDQRTICEN